MTGILLPFIMSMLLGRSIDLRSYEIGGDVFEPTEYDEVKMNAFNTSYAVLQDNTFPYNYLGLPVDIVMRVKAGYASLTPDLGLDAIMKDTSWMRRSAVVIAGASVQTVQRKLKPDAKPLPSYASRISPQQTHYANSITYGGTGIVLYRFKCQIPGDVEIVRSTLTEILGTSGNFGPDSANLWKRALAAIYRNKEIRGHVNIHVHKYSTFPLKADVSNFTNLVKAFEEVPKLVGPVGKPIAMELLPLHTLDPKYPVVEENHDLDSLLSEVDEMFDDAKNTKHGITLWMDKTETIFSEEDDNRVADLVTHLSACLKLFYQIASEASVYKHMDSKLLNKAFDLYSFNLTHFSYTYDRMFRQLKEEIDAECGEGFLRRIKGLLRVEDSERIELGEVEGGLDECKAACLATPDCRSIGYIDIMKTLTKVKTRLSYKMNIKKKICYIYFRSSSTADVIPPLGATNSISGVYDRKCL